MRHAPWLAAAALSIAAAAPASAQCPASGASGLPNAEPIPLVLRYTWKVADVKPTALKTALDKLPTVVRTAFDDKSNTILVKFKGRCDQVSQLETAAQSAGVPAYVVNHAHVAITLKGGKGADLKSAIEALGKINGALYSKLQGTTGLELHADLTQLNIDEIRMAVEAYKCEATVAQSFEYVRFKVVEGKSADYEKAAGHVKGVMVLRNEGQDVVGMWLNKAVVKVEQLEKLEGFKLERK
jgi:hypothetical protein